jgi:hypothetical protein
LSPAGPLWVKLRPFLPIWAGPIISASAIAGRRRLMLHDQGFCLGEAEQQISIDGGFAGVDDRRQRAGLCAAAASTSSSASLVQRRCTLGRDHWCARYPLCLPRRPAPWAVSGRNVMPAFSNALRIFIKASSRASDRHWSVEATRGSPSIYLPFANVAFSPASIKWRIASDTFGIGRCLARHLSIASSNVVLKPIIFFTGYISGRGILDTSKNNAYTLLTIAYIAYTLFW